jgi:hypothetical protein
VIFFNIECFMIISKQPLTIVMPLLLINRKMLETVFTTNKLCTRERSGFVWVFNGFCTCRHISNDVTTSTSRWRIWLTVGFRFRCLLIH